MRSIILRPLLQNWSASEYMVNMLQKYMELDKFFEITHIFYLNVLNSLTYKGYFNIRPHNAFISLDCKPSSKHIEIYLID